VEPRYLSAWSTRTPCAAATTNSREAYAADRNEDGHGRSPLSVSRRGFESARVLDAGCGQGTPVLRDLDSAATAVGTDISRSQLELAAENVPDVALAQGDMVGLPFRNGSFDAVTAYHSLIHVPREQHQKPSTGLLASSLTAGGCSARRAGRVGGTNPDWLDTGVEMQWHIAGVEATRDHLRNAGFTVEREWRTDDSLAEGDDANWTFFAARLEE